MIYIHHFLQLEMLLHSREVLSDYTNKERSSVISLALSGRRTVFGPLANYLFKVNVGLLLISHT